MLKSIVVKDFQIHQSKMIELDQFVTTFVGNSDSGKSAIAFRALYWLAMNQPTGNGMVRWGASRAYVKLVFDDCEVVRKKGETVNAYMLNGSVRKAFGAGKVPDDVAAALKLDSINFQAQHDSHFWISESAGKVSQELNRVVDLSIIDSSLAAADSALRKAKATREVCEDRLAKAEGEVKQLAWVEAMSVDLDRINSTNDQLDRINEECEALESLLSSLNQASEMALEGVARAKASRSLCDAAEVAWRAAQEQESLSQLLEELAEAEAACAIEIPNLSGMERDLLALDSINKEISGLESLLEELAEAEEELCLRKEASTRSALALAEASQTCPLCGARRKQ